MPFELQVGPDRLGVEDALAGPFVAAGGARALAAEVVVGEAIDLVVLPGQLEDLLRLVGADIGGGVGHGRGSRRVRSMRGRFRARPSRLTYGVHCGTGEEQWHGSSSRPGSVNAVRKALGRAPGGVRVVGRFDRETIECRPHDGRRTASRGSGRSSSAGFEKAGLAVVDAAGPDSGRGGSREE